MSFLPDRHCLVELLLEELTLFLVVWHNAVHPEVSASSTWGSDLIHNQNTLKFFPGFIMVSFLDPQLQLDGDLKVKEE